MEQDTIQRYESPDVLVVEKKHNHLASAEMSVEANYNQIDGIINNVENPSMDDKLKAAHKRAREHNNRKTARHRDARHKSQADRRRAGRCRIEYR